MAKKQTSYQYKTPSSKQPKRGQNAAKRRKTQRQKYNWALIVAASILFSAYLLVRICLGDVWGSYWEDFKSQFLDWELPKAAEVFQGGLFEDTDFEGARIHFIDVGQGDCALIQTENYNILIDAGDNGQEETVLAYLKKYQISSLDLVIATHPHADHIGGMAEVINSVDVKELWMPEIPDSQLPTSGSFNGMLKAIANREVSAYYASPGQSFLCDGGVLTVLGPLQGKTYESLNDYSLVISFVYDNTSFLFTGDMESDAEKDLIDAGSFLSADVLKVGHHGSSTSSSAVFLNAVDPSYCVISVGEGNSYNHPHREIMERFETMGLTPLRTDQSGDIQFWVGPDGLTVATGR